MWGRSLVVGLLPEDITMTELRPRMIEYVELAGHSQGTQDAYISFRVASALDPDSPTWPAIRLPSPGLPRRRRDR